MARPRSSIGFFGLFGRSGDLRQLDTALRAAGVHPALVPEGAKLAIVNLMKDHAGGRDPAAEAYAPISALLAYCLLGADAFQDVNGPTATDEAERRIETALEDGDGPDAQFVLLTLHAKLIQPSVVDRFGLSADQ